MVGRLDRVRKCEENRGGGGRARMVFYLRVVAVFVAYFCIKKRLVVHDLHSFIDRRIERFSFPTKNSFNSQ